MKTALAIVLIGIFSFLLVFRSDSTEEPPPSGYDVYQYVKECKAELGITRDLPLLSCLDGKQVPIYVDKQEIIQNNWELLSTSKKCDNPHWLGGDQGCWTYSHLQVVNLDDQNIMVVNCRQKGNQLEKNWFRETKANLGMNQAQRKAQYESAPAAEKKEFYYLYNTFNDIGIILRNTTTGKSCYLTQYGDAVAGFLPPLDTPLPAKNEFLAKFNPEQAKPPLDFPQELWYRDANKAFKSPEFTASAGCVACHNAHGVKYSPYINSRHGLPDIRSMANLPFLPVGEPFKKFFYNHEILQVTTDPIDGANQLCNQCHNMTTSGTCGYIIDSATDHPDTILSAWLTSSARNSWMPPMQVDSALFKKHVAAMKCCCDAPHSQGCKTRKFGPTLADLPEGFNEGKGWIEGEEPGLCKGVMESPQWGADKF
jgi:cytochrome c553